MWEIAPAGAAAQRDAGGEPSGSTTRSAEREDFANAKPQGNPSTTTALIINELRIKSQLLFFFYAFVLMNSDKLKTALMKKNSRTIVVPSF